MKKETHYFYKYHFKLAAIKTDNHPEIQTKAVAAALEIHPFMLSRWKKEYREGVLRGKIEKNNQEMEEKVAEHKQLRDMENDLLKKSIQFASKCDKRSSPS